MLLTAELILNFEPSGLLVTLSFLSPFASSCVRMPLATNLSSSASAETWAVAVVASPRHAAVPPIIPANLNFRFIMSWL